MKNTRIVVGIPSGGRAEKLVNVVDKWRRAAPYIEIAVYTWDKQTEILLRPTDRPKVNYLWSGSLQPYAVNHNFMARRTGSWSLYICGADDCCPKQLDGLVELAEQYASQPKVIWVRDGLFDVKMTHPIITQEWFVRHKRIIFDEQFAHNFCDTDLFLRTLIDEEVVKHFDLSFDHRHYLKNGRGAPKDDIYKLGESSFAADKRLFEAKHGIAGLVRMDNLSKMVPDIPVAKPVIRQWA